MGDKWVMTVMGGDPRTFGGVREPWERTQEPPCFLLAVGVGQLVLAPPLV